MGWSDEDSEEDDDVVVTAAEEESQEVKDKPDDHSDEEAETEEVDLSSLAPSAVDVDEAAQEDHTFKMMIWADPGEGKTHFAYTMPEPVCIIDTENKASDIAHKFTDKDVQIWTPENFDEAVDYRDEALSFLSEYEAQTGKVGTLVIDSMAVMWEWSQHKYISEWYPNTAPDKVNLDLQDWPKIKDYHNKTFRKPMESCDYNVCWTSTRKDDVGAAIENEMDETPDKPGGETNNAYKVNSIIRLHLNNNGVPVGDLQKSGLCRFKYLGLRRPTFQKHKEIIEEVERLEADGVESAHDLADRFSLDYNISFTEANTMRFIED